MSSTGTRVVPTLTEVLDEHRLGKPATGLSAPTGQERRTGPEDLVPISLDWGDAPEEASAPAEGDVMTPWQVVRSRDVPLTADDVPFIDLSIDVAPVQVPDPRSQGLAVYPTLSPDSRDAGVSLRPFTAATLVGEPLRGEGDEALGDLAPPLSVLEPMPELVLDLAPLQPSVAEALADLVQHEEFVESVQPLTAFTGVPPDLTSRPSWPASTSSIVPEQPAPSSPQAMVTLAGIDDVAAPVRPGMGHAGVELTLASLVEASAETVGETASEASGEASSQAHDQGAVDVALQQSVAVPPPTPVIPPVVAPESVPATVSEPVRAVGLVAASESAVAAPAHHRASVSPRAVENAVAAPTAAFDPGTLAVRQASEHVPGISEERLQAILQEALDRLLRDELPSALVETLIRLSPQLSESLIDSLKPSLHLHVMEALSAESLGTPDGRPPA